uniref:B box-type domain-containing protein n=1 Tax=Adineta vaga TaxID=104782 RepID=B3G4A9_ADIVA|nr:unknown [Adineta vaga]
MSAAIVNNRCNLFFEPPHEQKCSACDNPMGIFTCHGCSKVYCQQHAAQHREPLKDKLASLIDENEKLDIHFDNDGYTGEHRSLEKAINEWEDKSIEQIRQAAAEARKKLFDISSGYENNPLRKMKDCHQAFTARLERAYVKNDYHEQHISYWAQFLEDLRQNYIRFRSNFARIEYCSKIFISKILVIGIPVAPRFTKWCSYQKELVPTIALRQSEYFQDDGYSGSLVMGPCGQTTTIIPTSTPRISSIYTSVDSDYVHELQTGEYRFRLDERCRFIGIMTKTANQKNAPLNTPSVYGWCTTEDAIYRDGYRQLTAPNDLNPGDTLSLYISSEQRLIRLKNLTRNRTLELPIDLNKCALPWQLKIVISTDYYQ